MQFVANFTDNHWANQHTAVVAEQDIGKIVYKERIGAGMSKEQAANKPMIHAKDCWPTNLTSETHEAMKRHLPSAWGDPRQIQPARGTGYYQVNDTQALFPVKHLYKQKRAFPCQAPLQTENFPMVFVARKAMEETQG